MRHGTRLLFLAIAATAACDQPTELATASNFAGRVIELRRWSVVIASAFTTAEVEPPDDMVYVRQGGELAHAHFSDIRLHDSVEVWHDGSQVDTEIPIYEGVSRVVVAR